MPVYKGMTRGNYQKSSSWFKDGDFRNHILNEKNIPVTENFINKIFTKYNFNYTVKNLTNFQIALTHVSYLHKSVIQDKTAKMLKDISPIENININKAMPLQHKDYNTFEYQGDAVIHLILTQYLCYRYPNKDSGFLTKLRTKLEKAETLSYLSKAIDLHKYVVIARNMEQSGARFNDVHLTEDIFESFMCALFLENSYDQCKIFLINLIEKEIDFAEMINFDDNYKEKIMQYFHKMKLKEPKYVESKASQKNNCDSSKQNFVIYLKNTDGDILGVGSGNTKSKAEQSAAHNALFKFGFGKCNVASSDSDDAETKDTYYDIGDNNSNSNSNNNNNSDGDYFDYNSDCGGDNRSNNVANTETNEDKLTVQQNPEYISWFKDGDFTNHILNEKNMVITDDIINDIMKKYNFNYKIKNINNFQTAMVHISYLTKSVLKDKTALLLKDIPPLVDRNSAIPLQKNDNSRLSHLGNAVIHLILTQYLCKRYSTKDQGFLTKLRTKLERADTMAYLAKQLNLHKYIIIARNMEQNDARITDNTLTKSIFEAFIGALSQEVNYDECYNFLIKLIEKEVDFGELLDKDDNYKEKIMQYFHKMKWRDPKYVDACGNTEMKIFVTHVEYDDGKVCGIGTGNTKAKAEQDAARDALVKLNVINDDNDSDYYGEQD